MKPSVPRTSGSGAVPPRSGAAAAVSGAVAALLLVAATAACGGASPPDGLTPVERFEWGLEHFREGDMGSARNGFREFLLNEPLHPMADSAQFLMGEAFYRDERYVEAAEAFSRLSTNRPTSAFADDAQLGVCRSYWALSPELALDQEHTRQAVDACTTLLEFYSPTPLEEEARRIRRQARDKLAAKRFRVAKWYYDHGAYESANIYLEGILENYAEAGVIPEVLAMLFRSYRELGFDSEARQVRQRLLEQYPDTPSAGEVRGEQLPGTAS